MRLTAIASVAALLVSAAAPAQPLRPEFPGTHAVVAAGRTYTAEAGAEMLAGGGNAIDAGVASIFAAAVVEISHFGLGGEAPMVIYHAATREVVVINGQGTAPGAATPAAFAGQTSIPANGPLAATIPAVVDAASLALARYGTKSLGEVLAPAIRLADGFPMYEFLSRYLASERKGSEPYADTMRTYYPDGRVTRAGEMFRQPNLARTLRMLAAAEAASLKAGEPREKAIGRARDAFYTGEFARRLSAAVRAAGGMITEADLAGYHSKIERPYSVTYRGYTVHKAGPWNQSPVLLQTLNLLEGFDLRAMGHLSADSIHVMTEAMKLAYADRDRFYGDPDFVKVPMAGLLSKAYAQQRRSLIDMARASREQRPGNPSSFEATPTADAADPHVTRVGVTGESGDTTAIEVADKDGNLFSATPSSGWLLGGAFVAGDTGVPMSNRMQAFRLEPGSPNIVAPGKRPRTTLTPTIVTRDGAPFLAIGTPGGDSQDQQILQVLVNVIDFGLPLQAAVDSARFNTLSIQSSFGEHRIEPGVLEVERGVAEATRAALEARGHVLKLYPVASYPTGIVAAGVDTATGKLRGAADVRRERSVVAW
ncbi:gamma-glutamyltranspeptidase [Luteitalea sp. TBR-22]|uniref:gamma-glutamyltransferase family protein n=1 Tax=Luteitalea sp. TBR-22 TaxID=2802971 RepID=UPI001AF21FE8|nr:gamma-glutamyltransferase family protein [Luteitalea sp. TBR-22]BCS31181.1 gamma-glutamyltranspeptidase [Luteitalea sp. TBR-22]